MLQYISNAIDQIFLMSHLCIQKVMDLEELLPKHHKVVDYHKAKIKIDKYEKQSVFNSLAEICCITYRFLSNRELSIASALFAHGPLLKPRSR